jgi:hypothetical protein
VSKHLGTRIFFYQIAEKCAISSLLFKTQEIKNDSFIFDLKKMKIDAQLISIFFPK